ncbi:hypothetical protein HU200_021323 [Digitaria exilis]|uniref:Uncharacterized protein n=1 Tax=Digitaria exilis TaxID=1010633 RepID=A0A835F069_9POAL|nr:hypothetical protein HU200_021323 [Digitaria exilis]
MKEPLEAKFVPRSVRLNKEVDGFKDEASAAAAASVDMQAIMPYAAKASSYGKPAPHLSVENVQGIATGFLQIQPVAVSAAILDVSDDEQA